MFYALAAVALGVLYAFGWLVPAMALAFLIIVHESGHYFVARWCKMRVERFSIGFGPAIPGFKWLSKSGTTFQLAPLPFGGFVEIRGMNILEEVDPEDRESYPNRPTWQRFLTIFAGPAMNYVSAIGLAFGLFMCHGVDTKERYHTVAEVMTGFDATDKLQIDDRILAVDGKPIYAHAAWEGPTLTELVSAKKGAPLVVTVRRDGQKMDVTITPKQGYREPMEHWFAGIHAGIDKGLAALSDPAIASPTDVGRAALPEGVRRSIASPTDVGRAALPEGVRRSIEATIVDAATKIPKPAPVYLLGILRSSVADTVDVGLFDSIRRALIYPIDETKRIGKGLYKIITREEAADPGGPGRIMKEFKLALEAGWIYFIRLLMMLSVYLGLFNLLPLPALDGGRLVFLTYELITRRRANAKIEATVHMAGIMILFVVMILVTLRDCSVI